MLRRSSGVSLVAVLLSIVCFISSANSFEVQIKTIVEAPSLEPQYDCHPSYYYYIRYPSQSDFWDIWGWESGDKVGEFFMMVDQGTRLAEACDRAICHKRLGA